MSKLNPKAESLLIHISLLDKKRKKIEAEIAKSKGKIKEYMQKTKRDNINLDWCNVYTITKVSVDYDISKIEEKLDEELYKQFVDKNIQIVDYKLFIKILKKYGVPKAVIQKAIKVSKSVNEQKLEQLIDNGKISLKSLRGCYETKESKSVGFRFNE